MNEIKCDCGHVNPYGTQLCQNCGKPLEEKGKNASMVDMRYEGAARRSQTYNKSMVDKIWNFFSSVKVGIWIIVLTLVASSIGTIFPQEMYIPNTVDPAEHYKDEYGIAGQIYYTLGFHNLYGSWWYMALIASLGISLIIASIDRVVPLYKALKNQRVPRNEAFLKRQRLFGHTTVRDADNTLDKAKAVLKGKRYNIREENGSLLAEKGRFSRWGPYVNHLGLVIFLTGAMLRFFPGMYVDDIVWVREGETEVIPGTDGQYFIENERFIVELYDENDETFQEALERAGGPTVKNFQTDAVLYKRADTSVVGTTPELEEVKEEDIRVNHPLRFDNFALYQLDYKLNELNTMTFSLDNRETGESIDTIEIDLFDPKDEYDLGDGYKVVIDSYFPNFEFNDDGEPSTTSSIPDNPAFIFQMFSPEHPDGEYSFVGIQRNEDVFKENDYQMSFRDVNTKNVTALTVRKDLTLPFIIVGASIFMIGLIQGSYWSHRRIWIKQKDKDVWIAGHANKHWESLRKDFQSLSDETGLVMPEDKLKQKNDKESEGKG
ncbi:cytochrome c biogenesis protein [Alteribacillus persepolensis]|uniref:Cytochrome c biogenesis protein n=1 Tax=Alteribacillus persepolensis TaxID=568899 RepID=A0A1G7ZLS7_9BACI|nr:cytochrome c biogenesis protein ResB [Alteribacillus persepolensis]SDH09575.1 cytochrome c biogenesis protein [Alteribacillus persepolensis]